ncbi:DODA-type extradiol aromatic ring-opening family dioxygenase [Rhodospirillum rubrum]|uniref:Extradiol ring-cleavage dioxygenase, class III enzyme, subunit B n=1 Tax=Rhodospirillum rubrum (strain ATCC 11170 / ATH 1.1.1 / DSM 467 / LMG 4362 / NCIMB 8255 / S1) TaxID=269796 RepID=Q2RXY1_RHORT|nr:class III extradiol ring-cleavage dioxygenase [Rhodospirillum rubrum]ABC21014.1 Extradiol ring-cleavage dioxygenase, class III enzyme, subunit B [Rhodospirillum rubrum ATCC 11170]AEO46679.1 extradiol ring-cleavage dioxygenase III subunit B [Rhodospirillum rubrum F11]MBK5952556.1 dioxygenase [Rhodospirillum rubrum]QXG80710.1 dioxygenase [Rhodospirillum rubrum]HCF18216.1 dioxygenase [Rhodospirillum rubrum]
MSRSGLPASLFLSHGSPALLLGPEAPAYGFLDGLGPLLAGAKALIIASAHWQTGVPRVGSSALPQTIHDFSGFPAPLYAITHPAPGAPEVALRTVALLQAAGFAAEADAKRGLDHGAWAPLRLIDPQARLPVVQVSLVRGGGPAVHLALGRALAPLIDDGAVVIGSGTLTHNLGRYQGQAANAPAANDVAPFAQWMAGKIAAQDLDALLAYRRAAPGAVDHHPTEEHLMPLYVALGAAGDGAIGQRLHDSVAHGVLAMDAYRFDRETAQANRAKVSPAA